MQAKLFPLSFFLLLLSPSANSSFWDSVPVISQIKSAVQAIGGDSEAARHTQENFSRGFILAAPVRAVVEHASGNHDEAKKTWNYLGKTYESMVDSTPVVGHVKGAIHYAAGDTGRGDEIMKAASRPVGVAVGGIVGMAGGPVGAVAGGIAGGAAVDGIITGIESAVHNEYRPNGIVNSVTRMAKNEASVGEYFDTGMNVVGDGVAGNAAGKLSNSGKSGSSSSNSGGSRTSLIRCRRFTAGCQVGYGQPIANPGMTPNRTPFSSTNVNAVANGVKKLRLDSAAARIGTGLAANAVAGSKPNINNDNAEDQEDENNDKEEDEDKDRKLICNFQPQINNRDENLMRDCVGKRPDEECLVRCGKRIGN